MKVIPHGNKFLVRKCVTGEEREHEGRREWWAGNLILPEMVADTSHWCEIVAVGADCKIVREENIGQFVRLPEYMPNVIHRIPGTEDFIVRESVFDGKIAAYTVLE